MQFGFKRTEFAAQKLVCAFGLRVASRSFLQESFPGHLTILKHRKKLQLFSHTGRLDLMNCRLASSGAIHSVHSQCPPLVCPAICVN